MSWQENSQMTEPARFEEESIKKTNSKPLLFPFSKSLQILKHSLCTNKEITSENIYCPKLASVHTKVSTSQIWEKITVVFPWHSPRAEYSPVKLLRIMFNTKACITGEEHFFLCQGPVGYWWHLSWAIQSFLLKNGFDIVGRVVLATVCQVALMSSESPQAACLLLPGQNIMCPAPMKRQWKQLSESVKYIW